MIFSLLLEFFLQIEIKNRQHLKAEKKYMTAQIMYSLTKEKKLEIVVFDQGLVKKEAEKYMVRFPDGETYEFLD